MAYIEITSTLEIEEIEQKAPKNWRNYKSYCEILPQQAVVTELTKGQAGSRQNERNLQMPQISQPQRASSCQRKQQNSNLLNEFNNEKGFDTDFLISPGDIYLNRKVKLEDAEVTTDTRRKFEEMCEKHPETFSKNNKAIGRTTLIEMEIDTGDSKQ